MSNSFSIDPREILGVSAEASLSELREAYHRQSRRYHPDHGGENWTFRLVLRSYEVLSAARVASRASEEWLRTNSEAAPNPFRPVVARNEEREGEHLRRGVRDRTYPPDRLVEVEMVFLRFELEDTLALLSESPEERNLSCSLSVVWPVVDVASPLSSAQRAIRDAVAQAFEAVRRGTRAASARLEDRGETFSGWLSYTTAALADDAFRRLKSELNARNLGVEQWIRDVLIPLNWRGGRSG